MPNFHYRALTQSGELVSGSISAPTAAEVAHRIDYLHLVPIDPIVEESGAKVSHFNFTIRQRAKAEDVTAFTLDLALLLKAGARLDDALELLSSDPSAGRLRPVIGSLRSSVLSGESFAEALSRHSGLFPQLYVALVRVAEASGTLDRILEMLASERRAEALRRKLAEALRYPAFVLFAAACVLTFFLTFVLPQFGAVLRDFDAKLDPVAARFLAVSDFLNLHKDLLGATAVVLLLSALFVIRHPKLCAAMIGRVSRLPLARSAFLFHRAALFCRNLAVLLGAGVPLPTTLRILADMMESIGGTDAWHAVVEQVRQGGKLSDAIGAAATLPAMAVRMLRLGEETGQLPVLARRVADFYEAKLQRHLDRMLGMVGPLAIITISVIVGGLIASVMTSLLSVSQAIG